MNPYEFTEAVQALARDNGITLHAVKASDADAIVTTIPVVVGLRTFVYSEDALRNRDYAIAEATLDWWDFDGSYRQANGFNGNIDIDEIRSQVRQ